ncbi:glycosyltransferase family 4 protein [Falsochrobactrum sp. TDYN1]|uniref:Glycosyltransferase family 4 protein n=1 Tax=Falsochrobactrum tianjinense TaxID=2706015 RepID=A0A949PNZ8_9HYPH|nr:glycosyltransferase family 4 protein [Falsochrobactrum sp. TDYN1]MBV2144303.1 glycosyltransferase family 4 protein [Falsochrobactrum sp. TDYN1]
MQPLHLVFVTSLVPHAVASTGYEVANAAVIDGLRRAGARVTVIGFTWPDHQAASDKDTVVLGEVEVRTEGASIGRKIGWVLKSFLTGLTVSSAKLRIINVLELREAIAGFGDFDAYVLNGVTLPGAFEEVFRDKPSLFVAHNVEHRSAEENARDAKNIVQKLLFRREAHILRRLENRLCAQARFVFTFAEDDGPALGLDSSRFATVPLVMPNGAPASRPQGAKYDLALIGTWTWHPNRIGLEWFLREVKPLLPQDISIAIAGNTPADLMSTWPGVNFVGKVPDATAFVECGRLVPLISRAGTGVQLKTIETFELGMPSVATAHSVRGISNIPANCTIADKPADFATAIEQRIETIRGGDDQRLDGRAFTHSQIAGMDHAISRGLGALQAKIGKTAEA